MTRYQKQIKYETQRRIARSQCKICQEPIGKSDYVTFEERYFHSQCLKQSSPNGGNSVIYQRQS